MIRTRLDAPIVLAHGLFGFRRIGLGRLTLTSYFRGIPEQLRASGNQVVVTRVPAIAGVKHRARMLGEEIEAAFPGQAVHIIGHSMGGLDARQLLADPKWAGRILSLTTIGTPHHGSAIADFARLKVGKAYRLLHLLGIEHRGFLDLTRRAARAVGRSGFKPEGVACFCVAGDPAIQDICWPLKPFFDILCDLEGPNDGLVSVASAHGFGTSLPTWPVDHFRQMSWLPPDSGHSSVHAILGFYETLLANLLAHGFPGEMMDSSTIHPSIIRSNDRQGLSRLGAFWQIRGARRSVEQNGHGHIAEHVGSRPATIEKPVDGKENGDLVGG